MGLIDDEVVVRAIDVRPESVAGRTGADVGRDGGGPGVLACRCAVPCAVVVADRPPLFGASREEVVVAIVVGVVVETVDVGVHADLPAIAALATEEVARGTRVDAESTVGAEAEFDVVPAEEDRAVAGRGPGFAFGGRFRERDAIVLPGGTVVAPVVRGFRQGDVVHPTGILDVVAGPVFVAVPALPEVMAVEGPRRAG